MDKKTADNLLKIVHDNYNEIAADFNISRKKEIWPEIVRLAGNVKEGDKVLDLGCGNGRLLEVFKDKKVEYLGLDNSEELIKLAKVNYPDNKFFVADILDLENIKDLKFNHIFCLATLQHLPSKELRVKAVLEMKKHILDGGQIIISNWNMWTKNKYRTLVFKSFLNKVIGNNQLEFGDILFPWKNSQGEITSERYYHAFRKRELSKLARQAEFNDINIYKDTYNYWLVLKK